METIKVSKSAASAFNGTIRIRKYRMNAPALVAVKSYNIDLEQIIVEEDEH